MKKNQQQQRVLARTLAEELRQVNGNDGDVIVTAGGARRDITQASAGDVPQV